MTASMSGVVPKTDAIGPSDPEKILRAKKARPVKPIMDGVTRAAVRQPNRAKMERPINIIKRVTVPIAEEKLPMKAE